MGNNQPQQRQKQITNKILNRLLYLEHRHRQRPHDTLTTKQLIKLYKKIIEHYDKSMNPMREYFIEKMQAVTVKYIANRKKAAFDRNALPQYNKERKGKRRRRKGQQGSIVQDLRRDKERQMRLWASIDKKNWESIYQGTIVKF